MPIGFEFQKRYATIVLDLEQLNKDLNKVLHEVQQYCFKVGQSGLKYFCKRNVREHSVMHGWSFLFMWYFGNADSIGT